MDDKTVNGMDTQNVLDDTEQTIDKLIKKKRLWTGIAVFWFLVWLLIIMYMIFYGRSYQDTMKPPEITPVSDAEPEPTLTPTPEPTPKMEGVSVKEYVIKFDKLSPKYTGKLFVETNDFRTVCSSFTGGKVNYKGFPPDALENYGKKCYITYKIKAGDDNFTAERTDESKLYTGIDKSFKSFTGSTSITVDYSSSPEIEGKRNARWFGGDKYYKNKGIWFVVERDRPSLHPDPKVIKGVGVIVSDTDSISNGVSTLEKKINSLKDNGQAEGKNEVMYTVGNLSLKEYADLVGKCFNTKGYIVSSTGEGDVLFQKTSDGGVSIKADDLKDGDTLVFFSVDRVFFTRYTAGMYSKVLQNDYSEILKVYDKG